MDPKSPRRPKTAPIDGPGQEGPNTPPRGRQRAPNRHQKQGKLYAHLCALPVTGVAPKMQNAAGIAKMLTLEAPRSPQDAPGRPQDDGLSGATG